MFFKKKSKISKIEEQVLNLFWEAEQKELTYLDLVVKSMKDCSFYHDQDIKVTLEKLVKMKMVEVSGYLKYYVPKCLPDIRANKNVVECFLPQYRVIINKEEFILSYFLSKKDSVKFILRTIIAFSRKNNCYDKLFEELEAFYEDAEQIEKLDKNQKK